MRHDGDHDEDDGDDDCDDDHDCDADHDDFKTYHQLSNKTKVSQHSMLLQSHFPPFSSHIPELQAVAHNLLVYRSLNIPYIMRPIVIYHVCLLPQIDLCTETLPSLLSSFSLNLLLTL